MGGNSAGKIRLLLLGAWASAASGALLLALSARAASPAVTVTAVKAVKSAEPLRARAPAAARAKQQQRWLELYSGTSPELRAGVDSFEPLAVNLMPFSRGLYGSRYQQLYKGIPVRFSSLRVTRDRTTLEATEASGKFFPGIELSEKPTVSRQEAVRIAAARVRVSLATLTAPARAELHVDPADSPARRHGDRDRDRLVWRVELEQGRNEHEVQVDAHDGTTDGKGGKRAR